ncbi:hypothetical protein ACFLWA_06310 [Chloroflexota bacterium]
MLETLQERNVKAIVRIRDREVLGLDPKDYLQSFNQFLDANFVKVAEGICVSPYVAAQCQK